VANQVPTYFITSFTDQVEFLVQQMPARLWSASTIRSYSGSGATAVEQFGATVVSEVSGRVQPKPITDTPADRRWIYPAKGWVSDIVDTYEELEMAISPDGWLAQDFTFAANRYKDDKWILNYFGTAYTGNTSTTGNAPANSVAFPAGNFAAVTVGSAGGATPTGMNVPKLRAARKAMLQAEVDLTYDPAYAGMSAIQLDDMLNQAQAISLDFQDKPVLEEGQITRFMGFEFIHTERLPVDASGYRKNPIWVKSGMRSGVWQDTKTRIVPRYDLIGDPFEVGTMLMVGATRLQEPKCQAALCAES
jgi:hypothetical protein